MAKEEKKMWNIFHGYDVDGGFGDAISRRDLIGTVYATESEIEAYEEKWDKPEVYAKPYAELVHHSVWADPIEITNLDELVPYDVDD